MYTIENEYLKAVLRSKSAELISLVKKETGVEYLWNGDKKYWGWTSPVLFPFVGAVRDKKYTFGGKTYEMCQHGFARNMEFELAIQKTDEIWFSLRSTEETKEKYPFDFCLQIGYRLEGSMVRVLWKVENTDKKTMYFAIGAHPAFMCPLNGEGVQSDCYMGFETEASELKYKLVDLDSALVAPGEYPLKLTEGLHQIEKDRFDLDALIIENHQTQKMWLAGPDKKPYVTVEFDAPLFGVWSPAKKEAPFICIEPWYGRSDGTEFYGTLEERSFENSLEPGEGFAADYRITIH
ncbi:MAG: aldose 1-epimerase family protein [Eubacteriales bacterium]|nr:aldose 1-epimerase family protein [Eubacteriales bacterium]